MICIPSPDDLTSLAADKQAAGPQEPVHKLPENPADQTVEALSKLQVWNSCSRDIIGYLKQGGFGLSTGMGTGVGFVTHAGLLHILQKDFQRAIVLLRSPHSMQYRFAFVNVIC